jgi:hypothetical protein
METNSAALWSYSNGEAGNKTAQTWDTELGRQSGNADDKCHAEASKRDAEVQELNN